MEMLTWSPRKERRATRHSPAGSTCRGARPLAVAGSIALLWTGCGGGGDSHDVAADRETLAPPSVMVASDWLDRHLSDPRLVVVDARPRSDYDAGHVPGAVSIPPQRLLDPDTDRDLALVSTIETVFGEAGIDTSRAVVVYDDENYRAAARVFWVLEVHGHRAAAVLDRGYRGWIDAGGEASLVAKPPERARFVATMRPERLATKLAVMRSVTRQDAVILDSRSREEYLGEVSKAQRSGHIPNAVNVSFERNLDAADGSCGFANIDDLRMLYADIPSDKRVITYCNSGNRASVSYLALRVLQRDVAVYDGSWLEWGNDLGLPIE